MSKLIYPIFCIVLLFFFFKLNAQVFKKLRIDPAQAYGGTVSDYFESVEYIPLETTKESLFGDALKFIVTDSSFVVFDPDTNALLFFASDGRFISKTKYPSREWPEITSSPSAKRIFVRYRDQAKVVTEIFDLTGKIISKKGSANLSELGLTMYAIHLKDNINVVNNSCYYPRGMKPKDEVINSIELYDRGKLLRAFLPVNQKESAAYCGLSPGPIVTVGSPQNGISYLTTTFTHYVYKLSKDSIEGLYQFVFPSNRTIPKEYLETRNTKLIDSLRQTKWNLKENLIIKVRNVSITGDHLFFKIEPGRYIWTESSIANAQYNFIYNFLDRRLVSFERIKPDVKSYFLPISNGPRTNMDGVFHYKEYSYNPVSSLRMFDAYLREKPKNPQYPPVLQEYYQTQNRKSNPVIVRMKLKE